MKQKPKSYDLFTEAKHGYLRMMVLVIGVFSLAMVMSVLQSCEPTSQTIETFDSP